MNLHQKILRASLVAMLAVACGGCPPESGSRARSTADIDDGFGTGAHVAQVRPVASP